MVISFYCNNVRDNRSCDASLIILTFYTSSLLNFSVLLAYITPLTPVNHLKLNDQVNVFAVGKFDSIYAEVVTFVASSLEAGGLPGSLEIPEVLK
jgi:hypothetical protein